MYKIYINETPLILISTEELDKSIYQRESVLITPYAGKKKFLLQYIDSLEKSPRFEMVVIHFQDLEVLWEDFKSLFEIVKAAGGLVRNSKDECLFIFRRGHWDLPKGKLDPGENYKTAAVREVKEECGLITLQLNEKLVSTYHVFRTKSKRRILKKTKWYAMFSDDTKLIPQKEEDILEARWRQIGEFLQSGNKTYKNIYDVLLTNYNKT